MKASFARFHREHLKLHGHSHGAADGDCGPSGHCADGQGDGENQVGRRGALKLGAAAAAAAVTTAVGTTAVGVGAAAAQGNRSPKPAKYGPPSGSYGDEMFDLGAVLNGAWDEGPYGPEDQRGSFNELTPVRTAAALRILNRGKSVNTYQLGEEMFNGFPAFPSSPPRTHDMFCLVFGYDAGADFAAAGGIQSGVDPLGPNLVSGHEERFAENFTFQIATQIDGLNHIGVGPVFYNGFRGPDLASPLGTTALGNETMGPVTARAVIYDVVGLKVAQGATDSFFEGPGGKLVLNDDYRVTLDDLRACLERQRVNEIGPGEVPIIHTGWTHLVRSDAARYLTQEPGIFLEEGRYFADRKVALVASDTWGLEVLNPAVTGGMAFPVHQELIVKNGIRIGESFVTDAAIADHVYEGVLIATPENVPGATCGSSPPCLLGQPGYPPR